MKESTLRRHLRTHLGIKTPQWLVLKKLGIPVNDNGSYSEDDVVDWLIGNGHVHIEGRAAQVSDVICRTPEEAAGHFGVSHTTIRNWLQDHTCPARLGFIPIQAVREWREKQNPSHRPARQLSEEERRVHTARAKKLEIDLAEREGQLVSRADVLNEARRCAARIKSIAFAFPDRLAKKYKSRGMSREDVNIAREDAIEMVAAMCDQMSKDLLLGMEEDLVSSDDDRDS